MKTAKQIGVILAQYANGDIDLHAAAIAMQKECDALQLDAVKEGMRRAAKVCDDTDTVEVNHSYYAQLGDASATKTNIEKAILTAAKQLTEKDLLDLRR